MSYDPANPDDAPGPADLVAYVDGRLDERGRGRVEAWLAEHTEAAAVVEEHRQVLQALRAAPPPEPADAAWAHTLARIDAALPRPNRPARRRRLPRFAALLGAAAAAALLVTPGDLSWRH